MGKTKHNKKNKRPAGRRLNRQTGIVKGPVNTVANRKYIKLNYSSGLTLTSTGNIVFKTYQANSLFEPEPTTGHAPLGFGQWSAFYNRYRVVGVKLQINAEVAPQADPTNPGSGMYLVVGGHSRNVAPLTLDTAFEQPNYRNWLCTADKPTTNRTYYWPINVLEGKSKEIIRSEQAYSADFSQNPPNLTYLHFMAAATTTASTIVRCRLNFTFYCIMSEAKQLPQSE
ncbi:MAG: putative capsid protein [Circoviridae sp.]|nr:MAG: putative capsid protein [Circoviridae sp.]